MNRLTKIYLCALALVGFSSLALADALSAKEWSYQRVNEALLKPLSIKESKRSKFSRAEMPPTERRLRITQEVVSFDAQDRPFMPFVFEVRYGDVWNTEMGGCVYTKNGNIFVERGEEYRPAAFLLGKNVKAVSGVCEGAPGRDRS